MNTYLAFILFMIGCVAGYQYRRVWKVGGATWQLWLFGIIAAGSFLTIGFVPVAGGN
ncbi:MAG: hypothetical protein AAF468_12915 [Pseudomonadota bacterium]